MADMTKKYLANELETYHNKLEDAEERLEKQNSWVLKGESILNTYFEKCASFKRLVIAPIVGGTSLVSTTAAIIVLKDIIPEILPFFGLEGVNVIVVGGSTIVFLKNLERYKRKKRIINESNRFAPCEFHKLSNGELSAACHLEKDKEKQIELEGVTREYKNYIKGLEKVYDKLVEEELKEKRLEEEALEKAKQIKQNEIKEQLETEWEAYLEEISNLSPSEVHLNDKEYLKEVEPIKLDLTLKDENHTN